MAGYQEIKTKFVIIATCVCGLTLALFFIPLMIILSLSRTAQTSISISIKDFNVTQLQSSTNVSNSNQSLIYFNLKLEKTEEAWTVYYDNLNLTFSYYSSVGIVRLGNYTIQKFHQGSNRKTSRKDYVTITNGVSWQEISKNVSLSSSPSSGVVFRVDLAGAVKFKETLSKFKSKTRKIIAWADVEVDRINGKKVKRKDIKLKHMIKYHVTGLATFALYMTIIGFILAPGSGFLCLVCVFSLAKHFKAINRGFYV